MVAMFLLLLTGVCWKFALRHTSIGRILFNNSHAGARTFSLDGLGRPAPGEGGEQGNPAGGNQGRGLSKECIARLPEIRYCLPVGECNEDEPVCSICLSEFEKDDVLKRIPACNHEFHKSCIEQWLCQHTSCPMCRVEIGSEPQDRGRCLTAVRSPELEDEVEEDGGVAGRRSTVARHTVAVELAIRRASDPVTTSNVAMGGYEAFPRRSETQTYMYFPLGAATNLECNPINVSHLPSHSLSLSLFLPRGTCMMGLDTISSFDPSRQDQDFLALCFWGRRGVNGKRPNRAGDGTA